MAAVKTIMEIYIWILTGLVGFILPILVLIAAGTIKQLNARLQDFVKAIETLNINNAKNIEQIKTLYTNNESANNRLNDHEIRIRNIERKCKQHE